MSHGSIMMGREIRRAKGNEEENKTLRL